MKAKVKVQNKNIQDPELVDMFQQMMDPTKADPEIVFPKYQTLKSKTKQISRFLHALSTGPVSNVFNDVDFSDIKNKSNKISELLDEHTWTKDQIAEKWSDFKDSMPVQESVIICSYLATYKQYLEKKDDLSDHWIKRAGIGMHIFKFSSLDIYLIWHDQRMTQKLKDYILLLLHMLYTVSLEIYNLMSSPDIDIARFSEVLIEAITKVQQQPELHRCKKAFNQIKNSVGLLQTNFSGYYKDFIQSKNPSTLIESFVVDVANNEKSDPESTRQFRKIVAYYGKVSRQSGKTQDPRLAKIFSVLEGRVTMLEKSHKGSKIKKPDSESESDASDGDTTPSEVSKIDKQLSTTTITNN